MTPLFRFFTYALAGYATLVGIMFFGQRKLMYHGGATVPTPAEYGVADMRPVGLKTADGLELLAWYRAPTDEALLTIVYYHGNAGHIGHRADKARPYLDAGFGVLLVTYRGYSGNPGEPSEAGFYHDARAALGFLDGEGVPAERIVVYGESLGSGVAVQMASERRLGAVVLEAPFTSMADIGAFHYWYVPARYLVRDRFDSVAKIKDIGAPLLVVHGERDRVVPTRFGRELFDAAVEPKESLFPAQAGHNNLYDHGAAEVVIEFLKRRIP